MALRAAIARFLGREVNVFSRHPDPDSEHDCCLQYLACGFVREVKDGVLSLSDEAEGEIQKVIDLGLVGLVVLIAEEKPQPALTALPGGKVLKMHDPAETEEAKS